MAMMRGWWMRATIWTVGTAILATGGCAKWQADREAKRMAEEQAAAAAVAAAATRPTVPEPIAINARTITIVHASGNQIYQWDGNAWQFKAPAAKFSNGSVISGRHEAGPSWLFDGGGKIVAKKVSEVDAPDANAGPWLLLEITSNDATGALSGAKFIQRINTWGGKAPEHPGRKAGDEVRVPYSADYVFREAVIVPETMPTTLPATQPATQP
jgi:hypothetical protein